MEGKSLSMDKAITYLYPDKDYDLAKISYRDIIWKLRHFWENHKDCWFRILSRRLSHVIAHQQGFPEDHLVYYETDKTSDLIEDLHPEAIITKESGLSGGFTEKVDAARHGVGRHGTAL